MNYDSGITTGWSIAAPFQIYSNSESFIKTGIAPKHLTISKIEVQWYDKDGEEKIAYYSRLKAAYALCFYLMAFESDQESSVELFVQFNRR